MITLPRTRWFTALLSLSLCASLCSGAPKIGVLLKAHNEFWSTVEKGVRSAASGADVTVKAPMSETDVAVQVQLLRALGAQGVDAIIVAPANREAMTGPLAELAAKGVKIVIIDTPMTGTSYPFVGTDQVAAGRAAGDLIVKRTGDKDEITFFKQDQNGGATAQRESGAWDAIRAARPNQMIHADIYATTDTGFDPKRAGLVFDRYPNTQAILASGTTGTMALLDIVGSHKSPITFVGFGFGMNPAISDAIKSGKLTAWIAQEPSLLGSKGIEVALALVGGKSVDPVIHIPFVVVTQDSLATAETQALASVN